MQWDPPDWTTASPSDRGFCKPPGRSWGSPGRGEESVSNSEIQRWNGARPAMVTGALAISISCLSPTYSWGRREIYRSSFALHTRFADCCACGVHKDFRRIFLIERAPPNSPRELHARARTALLHRAKALGAENLKHKRALTRQAKGLLTLFIFLMRSGRTFCTSLWRRERAITSLDVPYVDQQKLI